jgi:ketosteroid isomerase-like protein
MVTILLAIALSSLSAPTLQSLDRKDAAGDIVAVRMALTRFLTAFENLDWDTFRSSFDDNATVFFPSPEPPERCQGRVAFEARFRKIFDGIRREHPGGPPFHHLEPEDVRTELLGPSIALVTFHLRNAERVARRTIVFRRVAGRRWLIVHLHASNVARE